ncbi:MAG TPA: hypothetical protein VFO12_08335 [Sphingomicrobium sp.]|nr:hypothetical protein [Sphingomicrobium sp.]
MSRALPISLLLLLAACDAQQAVPPEANGTNVAEVEPATPEVPSLEGSWQVTMIDGAEARPLGMTATIGAGQASLVTGCFRRAWTYSQKGNIVDFTASPGGSSNCGGQTPGAQAETAYAALDDVNMAIFSQQGKRADMSGNGGNLTLERR